MAAKEVICIDSEEEDQNATFNRLPAEKLLRKPALVPSYLDQTRLSVSPPQQPQPPAALLGCLPKSERKQIEFERLARTKYRVVGETGQGASSSKRKFDDVDSPPSRKAKIQKAEESEAVPVSQFYTPGGSTTGSESSEEASELQLQEPEKAKRMEPRSLLRLGSELPSEDGLGIQFPYGVVKKTFLEEAERKGDDITIEEVLQRVSLQEPMANLANIICADVQKEYAPEGGIKCLYVGSRLDTE